MATYSVGGALISALAGGGGGLVAYFLWGVK